MISGNIEYSSFIRFQKRLQRAEAKWDTLMESCAKELAARLLALVKEETPTGDYKKEVQFVTKAGKTVRFTRKDGKVGGTLKRGWTNSQVIKSGKFYRITVFNPVYYAIYVEYGHRKVNNTGWCPGKFMLTRSVSNLREDVTQVMERKLQAYLGRYLYV